MKTVLFKEDVAYTCLNNKDIAIMVRLVNYLAKAAMKKKMSDIYELLPEADKKLYVKPGSVRPLECSSKELVDMYNILIDLGFCGTIEYVEPTVEDLKENEENMFFAVTK